MNATAPNTDEQRQPFSVRYAGTIETIGAVEFTISSPGLLLPGDAVTVDGELTVVVSTTFSNGNATVAVRPCP